MAAPQGAAAAAPGGSFIESRVASAQSQPPDEGAPPLDLDRDQEQLRESLEAAERADDLEVVPLPPGAADGTANPALLGGDEDPTVLRPEQDGGAIHPSPGGGQAPVEAAVVDDGLPDVAPLPEEQLVAAIEAASDSVADGNEPGELVERARELDLADVEVGDEIEELRTVDSQTFLAEDGTFRTEVASTPLFAEDQAGEQVDVDLEPRGSRDGRWRPTAGPAGVSFASTSTNPRLGTVALGPGKLVSWSLRGARRVTGVRDGDRLRFDRVIDDVDVELESSAVGAKETIVIHEPSAPLVYEFDLDLVGVEAQLADPHGAVELADGAGQVVGHIPAAWAEDSAPAADRSPDPGVVTYELVRSGGSTVLRVAVDEVWFRDPARVFPVRIDPPLVPGEYAMSGDTWIHSQYPTTNRSTHPVLQIGGGEGGRRSYLARWDVGWLASATILDADYRILNTHSYSCAAAPFQVYRLTSDWNPATVTWGSQPSRGELLGNHNASYGRDGCPSNYFYTPMTSTVQNWVDGRWPAYGVTGRVAPQDNYNANDLSTFKQFVSADVAGGHHEIQIVWSPWRARYELAANSLIRPTPTTAGSIQVKVTNLAPTTWNASGANRYRLPYHVYRADNGQLVNFEGRRTDLGANIAWNSSRTIMVTLGYFLLYRGPLKEEYIPIQNGHKSARRPDITMLAPDGTIYRENVGRTLKDGSPVAREVSALDDLEQQTGTRPGYTAYDRDC